MRREAQLFISARLHIPGLLIFVYDGDYDGDYWGYELFRDGEVVNRFVQYPPGDGVQNWFPGDPCVADPNELVTCFPELTVAELAPYLLQRPCHPTHFGS